MKVKYAVIYTYNRTGKLLSDGSASVTIRAYLRGKNKFFNTGIYIEPHQWNGSNAAWIKRHPNQYVFNQQIRDTISKMEAFEYDLINRKETVELDRLAEYDNNKIDISFTEFIKEQLEVTKQTFSRSCFTDQRQTFNKLKSFKQMIYFNQVNFKLIKSFDTFLYQEGTMSVNTIAKHHKNLKKFVNLAIKEDLIDVNRNPYKKFTVKRQPTERLYLNEEELLEVEKVEFKDDNNHLEVVRDFFLFMCYTGLRYSDASKVVGTNFIKSNDGLTLYFTSTKSKKPMRINLKKLFAGKPEVLINKYLDKYDDVYFDDPDNPMPIFFRLSNQYINRELKTIVGDLNIRENLKKQISCHVGRHTFGTALAGKVRLPVLQEMMQHSRVKETEIYVHMNPKRIDEELDKIDW